MSLKKKPLRFSTVAPFLPNIKKYQESEFASFAKCYCFGVFVSNVHVAWVNNIENWAEMSRGYVEGLKFKGFPFPDAGLDQMVAISKAAKKISKMREPLHGSEWSYKGKPTCDPDNMSADLLQAHKENDALVMAAYGFDLSMPEEDIVKALFKLYLEKVDGAAKNVTTNAKNIATTVRRLNENANLKRRRNQNEEN